ncbi:hypothetical protein ACE1BN_07610, partial [Aeromonas veronii]|uniref:hypothetical protein n=1 Tax=Aeromonas veronii TaxID=654 RepID=UPI0035B835AB
VNLEYLFCQIYADCRSLHGGRLSHQWERTFATLALQMPFWVGATIPLTTPWQCNHCHLSKTIVCEK